MKSIHFLLVISLLLILVTGCAPANTVPVPATSTVNPEFLQATPFTGPITLDILKNAEYQAQNGMKLVKLVNGSYQEGSGTDFLSVSMLDAYALGDLNADGVEDAAVVLAENYGGTGQFEYLVPVFFIEGGAVSPSSGIFLGDRVKVNSMSISAGVITMDMLVHAPNDGLCCPSLSMSQSYRFYSGPGLTMVHATSGAGTAFREIKIEIPAPGSEVTRKIQIKGSVTIAPFENTLKVRISDSNYGQIYEGPIMVTAAGMGAPGTFDVIIDLSTSPTTGGTLHIEVLDVSMADGSTIALDSVDVVLK
jgi:hypothetical protein